MKRWAIFFALVILLVTGLPAHAENPVSLAEYQRALTTALELVQQAEQQTAASRVSLLTRAVALLKPITHVQTETGMLALNNDALIGELESAAQNPYASLTAVRNRLRALRTALDPAPVAATSDERAKLRDIFNRPPFAIFDNPVGIALQEFLRWLRSLTRGAGDAVFGSRDLLALGGIVVLVGVLAFFLRNLRRNITAEESLVTPNKATLTAREALARAHTFVAEGDYRAAMHLLYLAALLSLDERGALQYDPALTNREHVRALAQHPTLSTALAPIVETYDRVWYGFANVTPEEFAEFRRRVQELQEIRDWKLEITN